MIKTIIFDLNKVLVTYENVDINDKYLKELGVDQSIFWKAGNEAFKDYNTGKINFDELLAETLKRLNLDVELIEKAKNLHKESFTLVDGVYKILSNLKLKYNLILLAGDGEHSLNFKLDNFNLRKFFTKIYATCYEGVAKDKSEMFIKLINKEQLNPIECLFIDDMEKHINIARELGINAILFKDSKQLKKEFLNYKINI